MARKRKSDDRAPSIAGAYAPPPGGARSKGFMIGVAAVVGVCVVVFLLALALG